MSVSTPDAIGTAPSVLIKEVSLFQGSLVMVNTAKVVVSFGRAGFRTEWPDPNC